METLELVKRIICRCLQLDGETIDLGENTQLLGGFPEFNSLTIAAIVASIEEELDVDIDDSEISAETFETVGTLAEFTAKKSA